VWGENDAMSWGLRPVRGFPPFQHENAFCQVSLRAGVARLLARFLLEAQEGRWRRLNGYRLVPLVRAGARFLNGELVERNEEKVAA